MATSEDPKKSAEPVRRRPPWRGQNPWRRRLADRLADLGGQYRAPRVADQPHVQAEEQELAIHPVRMREEAADLHRCPEASADCW